MMAISELQARQGNVNIIVNVIEKEEPREFEKFGKTGRVCNTVAEDATGKIKLTLWNEQIDQVSVGDQVKITNGYVSEWQGEKQLSTGKMGSLEVTGKSAAASAPAPETQAAPTPAPAAPAPEPKKEDPGLSDDDQVEIKPDVDEEEIEF